MAHWIWLKKEKKSESANRSGMKVQNHHDFVVDRIFFFFFADHSDYFMNDGHNGLLVFAWSMNWIELKKNIIEFSYSLSIWTKNIIIWLFVWFWKMKMITK